MNVQDIIFRGKSINQLNKGQWVYGSLLVDKAGRCRIYEYSNFKTETHSMYDVDPKTVGQYTTIKDSKGTKIYNNDAIWVCAGYSSTVVFQEGMFMSKYEHIEDGETLPLAEVIGKETEVINDDHDSRTSEEFGYDDEL